LLGWGSRLGKALALQVATPERERVSCDANSNRYFAACSGWKTARHPGLKRGVSRFMHATMRSTFGISELQSRNTSGVQAARSSAEPRAKLWVANDVIAATRTIANDSFNGEILPTVCISSPMSAAITSPVERRGNAFALLQSAKIWFCDVGHVGDRAALDCLRWVTPRHDSSRSHPLVEPWWVSVGCCALAFWA